MHSETTLRIEPDHPAFAGHFPGTPIVPGAWLLDAVIHAWQQLQNPGDAAHASPVPLVHIDAAKFLSPVGPGEVLIISLDAGAHGRVRFEISSNGRKVASGSLAIAGASSASGS
jgi:3-hydroxymyristoyl/3-hydroxydecanoyl-(acyl carrier protein) dehydratase